MLFQRISRKNPERVFGIFQNVDATAMADGDVVVLNSAAVLSTTFVVPGSEIKKSTALSQTTVVGVVAGAIAVNDFGTVQVYGVHPNVKLTTATLAFNTVVYSNAAAAAEANAGAIARADIGTMLGITLLTGVANRTSVFIKCMGG